MTLFSVNDVHESGVSGRICDPNGVGSLKAEKIDD